MHKTLRDLVHRTLATCAYSTTTLPVMEITLKVDSIGERDPYMDLFISSRLVATIPRDFKPPPLNVRQPSQNRHEIPPSLDFFSRWSCLHYYNKTLPGSISDVKTYLTQLKQDLEIGHSGYPSSVVVAGDQQTYA